VQGPGFNPQYHTYHNERKRGKEEITETTNTCKNRTKAIIKDIIEKI
jgi:hypothetical protein